MQQAPLAISVGIIQVWWKPVTYSVGHRECILCCDRVPLYFTVCLITVRRNIPSLGRSLQEVLFRFKKNWECSHNSICQGGVLFICKSQFQGAGRKAFHWSCLFLSSSLPAPFPLPLRSASVWLLRAWWGPGCYSECRGLKEIFLSPSLSQKIWTQEDPFKAWWSASQRRQYVPGWQTESCLDSEDSRALSKHQLSEDFAGESGRRRGPLFRLQLQLGTISLNKVPLFPKAQFSGSQLLS